MAMLQMLGKIPDRFSDLAEMVFNKVLMQAGEASRVDFVGDQYPRISIKNAEREKRGSSGQLTVQITSRQQICPRQWKKFMSCGSSKEGLMHFLAQEWSTNQAYARKIRNRVLYIHFTHGNECTKLVASEGRMSAANVEDLYSTQEEADTRMFLHALHASLDGHHSIAVISSDTDVEVLACYHQAAIPADITLISGTRSRSRLVSIPRLCEKLGPSVCQVLPGLHALTGCDTVSAFAGKGKKKAFDMVTDNEDVRETLQVLGDTVPLSEENIVKLEEVVCKLYGDPQCKSVNELRYKMFCKGNNVQSHKLPPTRASLGNHLRRVNYQVYCWKRARHPRTDEGPENQGWQLKDGLLEIGWTDIAPASEAVMEIVCCGCHGACQTRRCSCVSNGLPCTEACRCSDQCVDSVTDQKDEVDGDE